MITCKFEDSGDAKLRHVVVHAIVEQEGKLLLVKRRDDLLEGGKWGFVSGFLDRDETAEEGVLREMLEESGWKGKVVGLLRINSRPFRPHDRDRQSVAIEFIVKPLEKVGEPDDESTKVEWVSIEDLLPFDKFSFDHGESIELYLKYKKEKFQIPIIV